MYGLCCLEGPFFTRYTIGYEKESIIIITIIHVHVATITSIGDDDIDDDGPVLLFFKFLTMQSFS